MPHCRSQGETRSVGNVPYRMEIRMVQKKTFITEESSFLVEEKVEHTTDTYFIIRKSVFQWTFRCKLIYVLDQITINGKIDMEFFENKMALKYYRTGL